METKTVKRSAAASAVAAVTAASLLAGGLFDAPAEFLEDDAAPSAYFDTLLDGGGDGGDGDADGQAPGEMKRRSLRAGLRERALRLPFLLRLLVLLPLWALGSGILAAGGALLTAASPLMEGVLGFVLRAAVLLGAFLLAVKAAFPDLPLKTILNRRRLPFLLLGAAVLTAADGFLAAVWPDYAGARRIAGASGALLVSLAAAAAYALRERRRLAVPAPEAAEEPPSDKLYFTDPGGDFTLLLK